MRGKYLESPYFWQKVSLILLSLFLVCLVQPVIAQDENSQLQDPSGMLTELESVAEGVGLTKQEPTVLIGDIVNWILGFMGVILAIMVIYGGIRWMTAAGNAEQIDKAKNTIINGIIGLVIVFLAYSIARFVLQGLEEVLETNEFVGPPEPPEGED